MQPGNLALGASFGSFAFTPYGEPAWQRMAGRGGAAVALRPRLLRARRALHGHHDLAGAPAPVITRHHGAITITPVLDQLSTPEAALPKNAVWLLSYDKDGEPARILEKPQGRVIALVLVAATLLPPLVGAAGATSPAVLLMARLRHEPEIKDTLQLTSCAASRRRCASLPWRATP